MKIIQYPTMTNPQSINTVDELRVALDGANAEIMQLVFRNSMLETAVSHLGNDVADIAEAFNSADAEQLTSVALRISQRVAASKLSAQAAAEGRGH